MSVDEVGQLFLDEYKSDKLRDLIKRSSQAVVEDNIGLVEKLSKEIAQISGLSLGGDNFLAEDIKVDVKSPNGKVVLGTNIKPKTAVGRIKKWLIEEGKLCTS